MSQCQRGGNENQVNTGSRPLRGAAGARDPGDLRACYGALGQILLHEAWTEMHIELDEGSVTVQRPRPSLTNWTSSYG